MLHNVLDIASPCSPDDVALASNVEQQRIYGVFFSSLHEHCSFVAVKGEWSNLILVNSAPPTVAHARFNL